MDVREMDRQQVINEIEQLYPADDNRTADIGQRLLEQARKDVGFGWRDSADIVLYRYLELCRQEDDRIK